MQLLTDNWESVLWREVKAASQSVFVISPFLTGAAVEVFSHLRERATPVPCRLLTRLKPADMLAIAQQGYALRDVVAMGVEVKTRRGVHAKAYFFDGEVGIVTSANLTERGMYGNYEMGFRFTRAECPEAFLEAQLRWNELTRVLTVTDVDAVLRNVEAHRAAHAGTRAALPPELVDQSETPPTQAVAEVIALRNGARRDRVEAALQALRASREWKSENRIDDFESDLRGSEYNSVGVRSFLWLAGWCDTNPGNAMERARELATEMFGYIPPRTLVVAGREYDLMEHRYSGPIPFTDEIIALHEERMREALRSQGGRRTATTVLGSSAWRQNLQNRDRDFTLFRIPPAVVSHCVVVPGTKRLVRMTLDTGVRLEGFASITSGTELRIPSAVQDLLRQAQSFDCHIDGTELGNAVTLARV